MGSDTHRRSVKLVDGKLQFGIALRVLGVLVFYLLLFILCSLVPALLFRTSTAPRRAAPP